MNLGYFCKLAAHFGPFFKLLVRIRAFLEKRPEFGPEWNLWVYLAPFRTVLTRVLKIGCVNKYRAKRHNFNGILGKMA